MRSLLIPAALLLALLAAPPAHAAKSPQEEDLPLDLPLPPPPEEPRPTPTPAPAPAPAPTPDASSAPQFLLGVQVGPTFPGVFNRLGVSGIGNLQGAWQLPWRDRELGVFFQLGYTQPSATGTRSDPRLLSNGGTETWRVSVLDFSLSFGADYILQLPARFIGFAALGITVHFSRSVMEQKSGTADLGTTAEDSNRVGYVARVGAGYPIGPGYLTLELENEFSGIDHVLTGTSNTGHLAPALGYLLRL